MDYCRTAEWLTKIADFDSPLNGFESGGWVVQDSSYINGGHRQLAGAYQVQCAGAELGCEEFGVQLNIPEPGGSRHRNHLV
jgi:hypothetical protein